MQPPKPYREERPWGEFIEFVRNSPATVKIITVKPHEALSLQTHAHRDELWWVLSGDGVITKDADTIPARVGDSHFIPRGTNHRLEAGTLSLSILEISLGNFDDNDIQRLEDKYGRASTPHNSDKHSP